MQLSGRLNVVLWCPTYKYDNNNSEFEKVQV